MGLTDPDHEPWPTYPIDDHMLQPLQNWETNNTTNETPWVCTKPLCNYTEYHSSHRIIPEFKGEKE